MGYSTCGMHGSRGPRTCDGCDRCPRCDGFRATIRKCPVEYCARLRLCPECRERIGAGEHDWCERARAEMRANDARIDELARTDTPVRCAAVQRFTPDEPDRVHVLFRRASSGAMVGYYMAADTYHAISLGLVATPEDYEAHGSLTAAPDEFVYETAVQ